ncbi:MAG: hypothetical protein ABEJ68_10610 [Halobacteriaceae archaeon]
MRLRAVTFGVAVCALLAFFLVTIPLLGHAAVGFAGGFVGGVLAGGGARPGLRHGAAIGGIAGIGSLALGGALAATFGVTDSVPPPLEPVVPLGLGDAGLVLLGSATLVLVAAAAGALGGWLRGTREFPGRMEEERAVR